jgi:hypothetical protein
MAKPALREPFHTIMENIAQAMVDGLHNWRPDLSYPESYSDMQGCILELMSRFELLPRRVPLKLADMVADGVAAPRCGCCGQDVEPTQRGRRCRLAQKMNVAPKVTGMLLLTTRWRLWCG